MTSTEKSEMEKSSPSDLPVGSSSTNRAFHTSSFPSLPPPVSSKRSLSSDDSDEETQPDKIFRVEQVRTEWPRYLMVKSDSEEFPLRRCNAFAIEKTIFGQLGCEDFKVTRLSNGNLIVQVTKERHSRSLLSLKNFNCCGVQFPVTVMPHRSLNSSKGVARSPEFKLFQDDDDILLALQPQRVSRAQRMMITRDGQKVPTGTVFLTFETPSLPKKIKLGFLVVSVEEYIPNPMRCFTCQRYGHTSNRCKRSTVCSVCAEEGHDNRSCENQKKCINCDGDHPAFSKECPLWKQERAIQEVKVKRKLSYFEAKKVVLGNSVSSTPLFSSVVSVKRPTTEIGIQTGPPMNSVGTQTDPSELCIPSRTVPQGGEISRSTSTSTRPDVPQSNTSSTKASPKPSVPEHEEQMEEEGSTRPRKPKKKDKDKDKHKDNKDERARSPINAPT